MPPAGLTHGKYINGLLRARADVAVTGHWQQKWKRARVRVAPGPWTLGPRGLAGRAVGVRVDPITLSGRGVAWRGSGVRAWGGERGWTNERMDWGAFDDEGRRQALVWSFVREQSPDGLMECICGTMRTSLLHYALL